MSSYYVGLVIQACISIIAVTGIFALTGLAGMFSLGQAAYMAVGAYVTFILAENTGLPFWITSLGGIATCALVAWVAAMPTVRMRKDYFSLISVGLGQAITALLITFSDITNGSQGYSKIPQGGASDASGHHPGGAGGILHPEPEVLPVRPHVHRPQDR